MVARLEFINYYITEVVFKEKKDAFIPEWIFLWAVRLDFEEKDLPQVSQVCLESPECM